MKDFTSVFEFFAGKKYNAVNTNENEECSGPMSDATRRLSRASRKGSVVLNRLFADNSISNTSGKSRCAFFLVLAGVLSLGFGFFILFVQPYDIIFKFKIMFSEGGETYELWRKPPVDLYLKVYLFNVTNRAAYLAGKEKLRVQEVGPYVYKEFLEHKNVTFNDNGTMTTTPYHPLVWVPEMSQGHKEDDILILPNIALLSIAQVMKDASYFTRMGLNLLIRQTGSEVLVAMTAKEFMFGYKTTLVTLGNKFLPGWIKFDRLGLIDRMYDFDGDVATVYSGQLDITKGGLIDKYNRHTHLQQWEGECGLVSGASDGTKFPSLIKPEDSLLFFRKSICRAMPQVRIGDREPINGLEAYKYTFRDGALDNGQNNSANKCFCRKGHCLPYGLIDVTDCYYGFPIAVSYPHFYKSDPALIEEVDGSSPDEEKHKSYFYVQPESGLPLKVAVRFQINMALGNLGSITRADKFKNMVLPMLWTEISMAGLPEHINNRFYLYLNVLPMVQQAGIYLLFLAGATFLLSSILKVICSGCEVSQDLSDVMNYSEDEEMNRKRLNYIVAENRSSIKYKEMDVFYSSLLPPAAVEERMKVCSDNLGMKEEQFIIYNADTLKEAMV